MSGDWEPIRETMILSRDADYVRVYERHPDDPVFPEGTTAEIVITRGNRINSEIVATWPAEHVSQDAVSFWVQLEETNLVPDNNAWRRVMVHYPPAVEGGNQQDWCWYAGPVRRK
ncbi:hypothetical protein AAI421_14390 [Rhodococcus aetherivorans]|uniref:LtfC-like domain-containing protein n=1 Tax=Rhodococcus aetherivorans TaxID=191292 RepID=UPI0031D25A46